MVRNVGSIDRVIRVMIALVCIAVLVMGGLSLPLSIALGVVAGVMLFTGGISFCPLYAIFGMRTCPAK